MSIQGRRPIANTGTRRFPGVVRGLAGIAGLFFALSSQAVTLGFTPGTVTTVPVGVAPANVVTADFDGDGWLDVASADNGANSVSVARGAPRGRILAATAFVVGASPYGLATADLNLDGHPDLVATVHSSHGIAILHGDGNGGFGPHVDVATGSLPYSVAVGDFNEDGWPDLVVSDAADNTLSILLANPAGGYWPKITYPTGAGSSPVAIAVGRVNGDEHLDVVAAMSGANAVAVMMGDGTGLLGVMSTLPVPSGPFCIALSDLDGDRDADIVVGTFAGNDLSVFFGDGGGGFAPRVHHPLGASGRVQGVVAADLDDDGHPEIAAVCAEAGRVMILRNVVYNTGAHAYFEDLSPFTNVGSNPVGLAVADLDGDGFRDIVVADYGSASLRVVRSLDEGPFLAQSTLDGGVGPASVRLADLNGDGYADLVAADRVKNSVSVRLADGAGSFGSGTKYGVGPSPADVLVVDANGDGHPDIVTANSGGSTVSVLLQLVGAPGTFGAATDYASGAGPVRLASGQLNADTHVDLAVADSTGARLVVMYGNGSGGFPTRTNVSTGNAASCVAVADLDDDGLDDVVAGYPSLNAVYSFRQLPGGGFLGWPMFSYALAGCSDVARGDFDGDGRDDLAIASETSTSLDFYFGTGAFHVGLAPSGHLPDYYAHRLAAGDLDGDGVDDLAVSCGSTRAYMVGYGQRGGVPVFTVNDGARGCCLYDAPEGVALGDVDGDGELDLALAMPASGTVATYAHRAYGRVALGLQTTSLQTLNAFTCSVAPVYSPGLGVPTGAVRIFDGTTQVASAALSGGAAQLSYTPQASGDRDLTVTYDGDATHFGCVSAPVRVHVFTRASALIQTAVDEAPDEGRQVRLAFLRSPLDRSGAAKQMTEYVVYRERFYPGPAAVGAHVAVPAAATALVPVLTVAPTASTSYSVLVPTIGDGEPNTCVFWVVTRVNPAYDIWSQFGILAYSTDETPPPAPPGGNGTYSFGATHLDWSPPSADVASYKVYRATASATAMDALELIGTTTSTHYDDPGPAGRTYAIAAVDSGGNEGPTASIGPGQTTGAPPRETFTLALSGARPNPARSERLTVHFSLPDGGPARLELMDVAGRRVRQVDVGAMGAGPHAVELSRGERLAPGIYPLRLVHGSEVRTARVCIAE